jgi:hypothetical protein
LQAEDELSQMWDVEHTLQGTVHITSVSDVLQTASAFRRVLIFLFHIKTFDINLESGFTERYVPWQIFLLTIFRAVGDLFTLALEF